MNLFEIMQSAGGGDAFEKLASQLGLSESEIRKAVEAFLPAFSAGLRRSTADPFRLMAFMQQMALGQNASAYRDPAGAFRRAPREYEHVLTFLFGSPEVARAVAERAAAYSGLAVDKMQELLAPLAAMTLGGLAEKSRAANPMLDALLKGFRPRPSEQEPAAEGPLDRLEKEQARQRSEASGAAALADMQEEMTRAGLAAFQAGAAGWQQAMSELAKRAGATGKDVESEPGIEVSGRDLFGEMFEPGLRLSETYRREVEALLERLRVRKPD